MIKPGAVVIDVGINRVDDQPRRTVTGLLAITRPTRCDQVASQITPVPGGVGPMTIAMLLSNTVKAARAFA